MGPGAQNRCDSVAFTRNTGIASAISVISARQTGRGKGHDPKHRFPDPPPDRQSKHVNLAAKQGS
eukprot:1308647-Prymnesium_polylepis.1